MPMIGGDAGTIAERLEHLCRLTGDLLASEQRYRDLFENANDIVFTTDLALNFTSLNAAGELATGYSREEAAKLNAASVVPAESVELMRVRLGHMLDGLPVPMFGLS